MMMIIIIDIVLWWLYNCDYGDDGDDENDDEDDEDNDDDAHLGVL
jgi:hypothetical protein